MSRAEVERRLAAVATRQHGVVTRQQALAAGLSPSQITRRLRSGHLRSAERGVYQYASTPVTWHSRLLSLCLASGGVASHRSAAVLWDLDGFRTGPAELTVRRGVRFDRPGVRVHETLRPDLLHSRRRNGIGVVGPARLAVDLASVVAEDRLVSVVDQLVRRRLVTVGELVDTMVRHAAPGRPGIAALRRVVSDIAGGGPVPDSDWNRTVARRLHTAGLPRPVLEHEVRRRDGSFVARVDLAWPESLVAVELDSEGTHLDRVAFQNDRSKRNELSLLGWRVLAFTWRDHVDRPHDVRRQVADALALRPGGRVR